MKVKVTIDIFSGRPNPTMIAEGREAKKILDQMSLRTAFRKTAATQEPEPFNLGYRGIIVEQLDKPSGVLPASMRVTPSRVYAAATSAGADDNVFEKIAFDNLAKFKGLGSRTEFAALMEESVKHFRTSRLELKRRLTTDIGTADIESPVPSPLLNICSCSPIPELEWWNDGGQRQGNNNCYNYATNYRTDTFAQPGKAAGKQYTSMADCVVPAGKISVLTGAIADQLTDNPGADNKCPDYGHLVALVIAPNADFHWYRKGKNGLWTHKPGSTKATNLDNSGNTIPDPRTANRGIYTKFCTFMTVQHGHIKIK